MAALALVPPPILQFLALFVSFESFVIHLGCSDFALSKTYFKILGVIGRRKTPWTGDRTNQSKQNKQNEKTEPMKINKTLTFAALATLAVALLLQTSITRADDNGQSDEHGQQAKVTFTKHGVSTVPVPGLILNMVGEGEGDAGHVLFAGEVLKSQRITAPGVVPAVVEVVAFYHFTGSEHSFSALVHVVQPLTGFGSKGAIVGVVTDGWLKGHALEGEYTVVSPCYPLDTGVGNCFEVTLAIARDSSDSIAN